MKNFDLSPKEIDLIIQALGLQYARVNQYSYLYDPTAAKEYKFLLEKFGYKFKQ